MFGFFFGNSRSLCDFHFLCLDPAAWAGDVDHRAVGVPFVFAFVTFDMNHSSSGSGGSI